MTREEMINGAGGTKAPNPVDTEITFNGKEGIFTAYNYATKEKNEVDLVGASFTLLLQTSSIGGYHTDKEKYISSPEMLNLTTDQAAIFLKGENKPIISGMYADIKEDIENMGGKFQRNLYLLSDKGKIVKIVLTGSSLNSWINFKEGLSKSDLAEKKILISEVSQGKKGAVKYLYPSFDLRGAANKDCEEQFSKCFQYVSDRIRSLNREAAVQTRTEPFTPEMGEEKVTTRSTITDLPF